MNTDYKQYYSGTYSLTNFNYQKEAYRNGQKIKQEEKGTKISRRDTLVKYDLDQKNTGVGFSSKQNAFDEIGQIGQSYGENVIVGIASKSLAKYMESSIQDDSFRKEIDAKQQAINAERNKAFDAEMKVYTAEEKQVLQMEMKLHQDDDKGILNHSFVNEAFDFDRIFEKAAYGYAKYLNPDIRTEYDDEIFYNCQDESLYYMEVSSKLSEYADNILSYFNMGNVIDEEKTQLKSQLADAAIEYAKNIASGNWNVGDVKTKISIAGVDITYGELAKTQELLQNINGAGVSQVGKANDTKDYFGLNSNYDTVAFAQLGLRTSQVNYFCDNYLSKEAGKSVKKTWNERTQNTIQQKYTDSMLETAKVVSNLVKEKINSTGTYSSSFLEAWKPGNGYNGSQMKYVYNLFAEINASSKDAFLQGFSDIMKKYDTFLKDSHMVDNGYIGSKAEKAQLAYLNATKWI